MPAKEYHFGIDLHRLHNHIRRLLEAQCPPECKPEVTGHQARILRFLGRNLDKAIYQKDIEKEFGITRSTASRIITRMEEHGLITRKDVQGDARLKQVVLTERSLDMHHRMVESGLSVEELLTQGFSEQEKEQLSQFIERMIHNIT